MVEDTILFRVPAHYQCTSQARISLIRCLRHTSASRRCSETRQAGSRTTLVYKRDLVLSPLPLLAEYSHTKVAG